MMEWTSNQIEEYLWAVFREGDEGLAPQITDVGGWCDGGDTIVGAFSHQWTGSLHWCWKDAGGEGEVQVELE